MKVLNKKEDQITFSAEIEESLANAVRRSVNNIPILAIDEVEISKNDSPLYDETIAHRIGLVPLKMEKGVNEKTSEQVTLVAKKEGIVYSGEINGKVKPVHENIPITLLKKGQELEILATAKVGFGSKHARFSPGFLFYRNLINVKIDKECPKEIVNICPQKLFRLEGEKVSVANEEKCDMCEVCTEYCKKNGKGKIELLPTKELVITIESFGQISKENIFTGAIEALKKDLDKVSKKISK